MRRVYLPSTMAELAVAHETGVLAAPRDAHAVTAAVREWYVEGDLEELEYAAATDAAQASLRLLAADPAAPRRRVILAADVPDSAVVPTGEERSAVVIGVAVHRRDVASVHVDDAAAEPVVVTAVGALTAADAGDDDAQFLLDVAEATDLLWYDVMEIPQLGAQ